MKLQNLSSYVYPGEDLSLYNSSQQPNLRQPKPATKAMTRTASAPAPGRSTRWLPKRAMRPPLCCCSVVS